MIKLWHGDKNLSVMKISDKINLRENNFDFLRFFAASLVIVTHSFGLTGIRGEPFSWISGYDSSGRLAVNIFFIISGFLITKSWIDRPVFLTFFKKRFLRVFPGLFFAVIFSAFIIGPIVTSLTLTEYFLNPQTLSYLKTISILPPMTFAFSNLPGVFVENYVPNIVNGSIWTLQPELIMYLSVAIFGFLGIYKKPSIVILIFSISFLLYLFIFPKFFSGLLPYSKLGIFFLLGSMIYLFKDRIILNNKLAFLIFLIWILSFNTPMGKLVNFFSLPYIVIYVAFIRIPLINNFSKYGDFSYGMYIYAYPIQQTILHFYSKSVNIWSFFLSAYLISFLFAFLSWRYVEKPFLKLKEKKLYLDRKNYKDPVTQASQFLK